MPVSNAMLNKEVLQLGLCLLASANPRLSRHRGWLGDNVGIEMPTTGTGTRRGHGCDLRGLVSQNGQHVVSTEAITARSSVAKPIADRTGTGGSLASGNKGVMKLPCPRTHPKEQNMLQGEFIISTSSISNLQTSMYIVSSHAYRFCFGLT